MTYYADNRKWIFDTAKQHKDLAKMGSNDLCEMAETNLHRLILAWDGNMPDAQREYRERLVLQIVKELRSRGVQLRLQF
jgi:hypothetical protein